MSDQDPLANYNRMAVLSLAAIVADTCAVFRKQATGVDDMPLWQNMSQPEKAALVNVVLLRLANPDYGPELNHAAMMATLISEGWKHGKDYDEEAKTHPRMMAYEELPQIDRDTDVIAATIINSAAPWAVYITRAQHVAEGACRIAADFAKRKESSLVQAGKVATMLGEILVHGAHIIPGAIKDQDPEVN